MAMAAPGHWGAHSGPWDATPRVTNNTRKTLEESRKVRDLKSINGTFSEEAKAPKPSAENDRVLGIVEPAPPTRIFSFS